jgi:hypothetical protein
MRLCRVVALVLVGWYLMTPNFSLAASAQSKLLTYTNEAYGVSFQYPSDWTLTEGDQVKLSWGYLGPVEDWLPHGVKVAAVEMPSDPYRGTDFGLAFLKVSVDTTLSLLECHRSAFRDWKEVKPKEYPTVWVGENQFSEEDEDDAGMSHQRTAQYYHIFRNQACYEFELGLSTNGYGAVEGLKRVSDDDVFGKLTAILATVMIRQPTASSPLRGN